MDEQINGFEADEFTDIESDIKNEVHESEPQAISKSLIDKTPCLKFKFLSEK